MLLLAEIAGTSDYVSGGAAVTMVGLVAWVLRSALPSLAKQYRDDVFAMQDKHDLAQRTQEDKHTAALETLIDRFDKNLDRILDASIAERKESRMYLEKELQKRDTTLDRVSEVLREIVNNVRILSEEVRTLKQFLPVTELVKTETVHTIKTENK